MNDKELHVCCRDYFENISKLDKLVERIKQSLITVKTKSASPSYSNYSNTKVQSSKSNSQLEENTIKIITLENQFHMRINQLLRLKNECFDLIGNMPNFEYQNILIARYLQNKEWSDIATELEFSEKWILKLHFRAIEEFAKVNKEFILQWKGTQSKKKRFIRVEYLNTCVELMHNVRIVQENT